MERKILKYHSFNYRGHVNSLYETEVSLDRVVMRLLGLFYLLFYEDPHKTGREGFGWITRVSHCWSG